MKTNIKLAYFIALMFSLFILLEGCSSCPGSQNPVVERNYNAIDLMKYPEAGEKCILSKMYDVQKSHNLWTGKINQEDYVILGFSYTNITFLNFSHVERDFENIRSLYNRYMTFFKKNGNYFRHPQSRPRFTCEYLGWDVDVNLWGTILRITAKRIE
jgi:hypothetical protein